MSLTLLTDHVADIEDPRQASKVTYELFDVLFLTLTAVISGAEGWEEIEDFGHLRLEWLKKYADFSHGIPVHDTIARLVCRIEPQAFHQRFIRWMQATEELTDKEVVAVDGKTLRRSYKRNDRQSTLHMISAFATKNGVVLGQRRTDEKSNEITAVPELLELLELEGAMVTLDAMSCQKQIVKTIVKKKADYCIAVKKNQKSLYQALQDAFELSDSNAPGHIEQEHGRVEYRAYGVLSALELPASLRSVWSSLATIGRATYYRLANGKEQLQYRYYISSASLSAAQFASTVRAHWGVENRLHWVLDVTMREDDCPISRGHAAANLASFRHVALNQIRREKTIKASVNRKQKMATMSEEVLDLIVNA